MSFDEFVDIMAEQAHRMFSPGSLPPLSLFWGPDKGTPKTPEELQKLLKMIETYYPKAPEK